MYANFEEQHAPRAQKDPIALDAESRAANFTTQMMEYLNTEYSRVFDDKKRQLEGFPTPQLELEPLDPQRLTFGTQLFQGLLDKLKEVEHRGSTVQVSEALEHVRLLSSCCTSLRVDLEEALRAKNWIWAIDEQDDVLQPGAARAWKNLQDLLSRITMSLDGLARAGTGKGGFCSGGTSDQIKRQAEELKLLTTRLHYSKELYADLLYLRPIHVPKIKPIDLKPTIISPKLPDKVSQTLMETVHKRMLSDLDGFAKNCEATYKTRLGNVRQSELQTKIKPIVMEAKPEDLSGEKNIEYITALRYFYGDGYGRAPIKALTMLRDIAATNPAAALFLGEQYIRGENIPQDFDTAERWIRLAYDKRFSRKPAYWMGFLAERKLNPQDYKQGTLGDSVVPVLNFYEEAIQNTEGISEPPLQEAFFRMGMIHEKLGLKPRAKTYYEQGTTDLNCLNALGHLMIEEAELPALAGGPPLDYTKVRRASEFFRTAAGGGHVKAMCNLANLLLSGKGVEKSIQEAKVWLIKASQKLEPDAFYYLGYIAHQEAVLDNSHARFTEASKQYRLALSLNPNHSQANYYLGCLLEGGFGGAKDLVLAAHHFQKALDNDPSNHKAMHKLGRVYMTGQGVKEADQFRAFQLLQHSANLGNKEAQAYLTTLQAGLSGQPYFGAPNTGLGSAAQRSGWGLIAAEDHSKKLAHMHRLGIQLDADSRRAHVVGKGGFMDG